MARPYSILWLACSGETIWRRERRLHGRADLPLTDEGRSRVVADVAHAGIDGDLAVVASPTDEAARETAAILARAGGCRTRALEDLAEPDLGLLDGLMLAQFEERFPTRHHQWRDDPMALVPPEGEPFADARRRILAEMSRLVRRRRGGDFAAVLHPLALGLVRCALENRPPEALWSALEGRPRVEAYLLGSDADERLAAAEEEAAPAR